MSKTDRTLRAYQQRMACSFRQAQGTAQLKKKHFSYGISNFSQIRREDYYYVDKTMFIPKVERVLSYLFLS